MFPEVLIGLAVAVIICYFIMELILKFTPPRDHEIMHVMMIIPIGLIMMAITLSIGILLSGIM